MQLYRINSVPESHTRMFLKLLNGSKSETYANVDLNTAIMNTIQDIRNVDRAVSCDDYVRLAMEADKRVARVLCLPKRDLRRSFDGNFNAYYEVGDENLTINVKNVDIHMNPAQGLVYDVYTMSRTYNYPIPNEGLNYVKPTHCDPTPNNQYPKRGGIDWTEINPKPKQKTFFEFAQTFWRNMINVRNRQYITDGKTGGYPTLQSIYWKYLESDSAINIPNDNFTYQTIIN
jgi:hypothetical protein